MKIEDTNNVQIHREKSSVDEAIQQNNNTYHLPENKKLNLLFGRMNKDVFTKIFYTVSGVFLFFFIIILVNIYVLRLKIETAVVSSPIETMESPVSGYITDVFVTVGEQVKKGSALLKIENIDLDRESQLARIHVDEAKLNVDYYQQLLANELQRLTIYKKIGRKRVLSEESKVNISKQDVLMAQQNFDRFSELHKKNYVSNALVEAKQAKYLRAQEQLKYTTAQQSVERLSLDAARKGIYFTGTKTEGVANDLIAEIRAAQKRVALSKRKVSVYDHLLGMLTMVAPFDGKVMQILKSAGNTTNNSKPIIFIERSNENKNIIAYLTQDEIIHIRSSKKVTIYIPSSGKTYQGQITEINRTDGFIDEVKAQYRWRDFQLDRSARVTIAIQEQDRKAFDQHAFSGMPAIVYFLKKFF